MKTQLGRSPTLPGIEAADTCEVNLIHLDAVRSVRATLPPRQALSQISELLGLLANPTRLSLLLALRPTRKAPLRELCVCDLAVLAGATKSMTSHQLRLLRTAGLVTPRRDGKLTYYRLAGAHIMALLDEAVGIVLDQEVADKTRGVSR